MVYSVTKHAAVSVAEWLSITYGDAGIKASCICPLGVRTPMLDGALEDTVGGAALLRDELLEPAEVAEAALAGIRDERLLIFPHPQVAKYMAFKGRRQRALAERDAPDRARGTRPPTLGFSHVAARSARPAPRRGSRTRRRDRPR